MSIRRRSSSLLMTAVFQRSEIAWMSLDRPDVMVRKFQHPSLIVDFLGSFSLSFLFL